MHAYFCSSSLTSKAAAVYSPLPAHPDSWVQVRFGGELASWRGSRSSESSDSSSSKTVTVPSLYFGRTKECNARGSASKWWYCLRENALFWQNVTSSTFIGPGVHPKAFALHTSGNSARYFHQPVTTTVLFLLYLTSTFVQTKKKVKPYVQLQQKNSWMQNYIYHTSM